MKIIKGRGKHRTVTEIPHGSLIVRAMNNGEAQVVRDLVDNVCHMLNVS